MFDTHCHLNFKAFRKTLPEVITRSTAAGVTHIVIPGTDVKTSRRAVEIAQEYENIYAACGIHPHHVMKYLSSHPEVEPKDPAGFFADAQNDINQIEELLSHPKVIAVGEIGMDRHVYEATVYKEYQVDSKFLELQKELLGKQIQLALQYKKSLILHNREAKAELLPIVGKNWDSPLENRSVFHCCEPDEEILKFAKEHNMFIGVDGDVTYSKEKQEFIKNVPLGMLVLETDSPFLLPEPLKSARKYPNEPANISIIAKTISELKSESIEKVILKTTQNARMLFNIAES